MSVEQTLDTLSSLASSDQDQGHFIKPLQVFTKKPQYVPYMVLQCTNAIIALADVEPEILVHFYIQLLGQKPVEYIPKVYAFQLPGLQLVIFKPKQTNQFEFENCGKNGMSLCLEVSDLDKAINHLTVLGYPPPGDILTASHGREIYVYDPTGNRLILHQSNK